MTAEDRHFVAAADAGSVASGRFDRSVDDQEAPDSSAGDQGADDRDSETGPLRQCVMTRERLPKERMIRFVVGPDRQLVPDLAARLPGRGIWLSASGDVIQSQRGQDDRQRKGKLGDGLADRRLIRAFSRAARGPVSVPSDLSAVLQAALERRIAELLGLTRRAGQAVAGFEKAREYLRTTSSRLVLQASDGSLAERDRFLSGAAPDTMVFEPLTGQVMGRIFGRDHVVHVAVAPGKLAQSLAVDARRLAGLRNRSEGAMGSERATRRGIVAVNKVAGANG